MRRFAALVIALVLAPGLQSAVVQTRPEVPIITTFPDVIIPDIVQLPAEIEPEAPVLRPVPIPEVEAVHPELIIPEVEAVVPEIISINPCDACFEYMTTLIDQLTEVAVPPQPEPEVPDVGLPAPEVPRPLPETLPEDLRPLPTPEEGEVEINPIPIPVVPETEVRPLPLPIAPEVEIVPLPAEVPQLIVSSEALPDDY